ncbi:MAG: universal stress protein [Myxococcaceae bacterium]|nr:universal stress protein [Myxococcaceae bacterium]
MLKRLLLAFDGSPSSRRAARFALSLAAQTQAEVTVLTVLPQPEVLPLGPLSGYVPLGPPISEVARGQVMEHLKALTSEFPQVKATHQVEVGPVADTILAAVNHLGPDLLVVGSRGLGAGGRFLLGSVSDKLVRTSTCPVTVWHAPPPSDAPEERTGR